MEGPSDETKSFKTSSVSFLLHLKKKEDRSLLLKNKKTEIRKENR